MMTKYSVYCDGKETHPLRLLGVLVDNRDSNFEPNRAEEQVRRHRWITQQLLPERNASEDEPIPDVVRRIALGRTRILYEPRRIHEQSSGAMHQTLRESLTVKKVRRGRVFVFGCQTCAVRLQRRKGVEMAEEQIERLVDALAATGAVDMELTGRRVLRTHPGA